MQDRQLLKYHPTLAPMIEKLFPFAHLYNWDGRANWGIGEDAFTYIAQHENFQLMQVFCHPKLLREFPTLLAYYRNIAALSRKTVMYLTGISVAKYEVNPRNLHILDDAQALTLSRLFNGHMTLIVDSSIFPPP